MPETWTEKRKISVSKTHSKLRTSLQLADVGLIFLHDLSDLLSFQRGVQHLVQSGVSLPAVDEVHELVQRDEWLPLGATGAEKKSTPSVCMVPEVQGERTTNPKIILSMRHIPFLKDALYLRPETEAVHKLLEGVPREIIWLESL